MSEHQPSSALVHCLVENVKACNEIQPGFVVKVIVVVVVVVVMVVIVVVVVSVVVACVVVVGVGGVVFNAHAYKCILITVSAKKSSHFIKTLAHPLLADLCNDIKQVCKSRVVFRP